MGKLRSINTRVWSDTWFEELTAEQKLLFFYLITNEKTNMLGMYEISVRKMAFETNIKQEKVEEYLMVFNHSGRVRYHKNTVTLSNFLKHQKYNLNMKLSAIDTYNNLPNELKVQGINKVERDAKGFETLRNHYGTVSKLEAKDELEAEAKDEDEDECESGEPLPPPSSPPPSEDHPFLSSAQVHLGSPIDECMRMYFESKEYEATRDSVAAGKHMSVQILRRWGEVFQKHLLSKGETHKTMRDYATHFRQWVKFQTGDPAAAEKKLFNIDTPSKDDTSKTQYDSWNKSIEKFQKRLSNTARSGTPE